ncbi:DUF1800 family protein [Flavicella sp.]|uniref:DUF1800 family protein n=1 Tax=Flavicella sp. TaxID=2957742 RepID=UPI002623088F|nr:DUF1800 family protein [Flavicella sp.]MDG1805824.1 DUF1800 family protein [Flavicella sp.]
MASLLPYSGTLGSRLSKHLLKRATYNVTKSRIDTFSNYTVDQALSELFVIPSKNLNQPVHYVNSGLTSPSPWINYDPVYGDVNDNNGSGQVKRNNYLAGWWMDEAKRDTSLRSKMTYFLFTDFTASIRTLDNIFHYDYLQLLEFFCLGDWKEFCFQMSKNNVMLKYLNNDENTKTNPNENFAREVLELFTIGKGPQVAIGDYSNYTESDVEQAARTLTGWTYTKNNRGLFTNGEDYGNIPCGYAQAEKHEFGAKQFSSRFGNYEIPAWDTTGKTDAEKEARIEAELKEFLNMVLSQEETAKFICRKMYRFFVSRTISTEIENDIIVPLSATFRANYNFGETITELLKSQHFYDADDSDNSDEIIGGLIKPPLDLVLQTLSITDYPVPDPITNGEQHYKNFYYFSILNKILVPSGQDVFRPPSVAGFPPTYETPDFDKFWFNSSTIISRYNMADNLLDSGSTKTNFYVSTFVRENVSNPSNPTLLVDELTDLMFPESVGPDRRDYFVNDILLDNGSLTAEMWADEWTTYMNSGYSNTSGVEAALIPLFEALTWSQEFQNN